MPGSGGKSAGNLNYPWPGGTFSSLPMRNMEAIQARWLESGEAFTPDSHGAGEPPVPSMEVRSRLVAGEGRRDARHVYRPRAAAILPGGRRTSGRSGQGGISDEFCEIRGMAAQCIRG